ncbi:hypothetical protein T4D_9096 [Trichinella pseudospiralis]|uniref:Uncharacterized protein n=1 Tax=Trichinella pseudospiralis TaxID=6337 RepID=A0A0V1FWA7_TRIPS|nr:hypothetical protein T4D_9096 [Trichinella pseudospiralis]
MIKSVLSIIDHVVLNNDGLEIIVAITYKVDYCKKYSETTLELYVCYFRHFLFSASGSAPSYHVGVKEPRIKKERFLVKKIRKQRRQDEVFTQKA